MWSTGTVGKYDATTGGAINPALITGLYRPYGLAVVGNTLYVVDVGNTLYPAGSIGKYDANTGEAINATLITGLNSPAVALAVVRIKADGTEDLLLPATGSDRVSMYDGTDGHVIWRNYITGLEHGADGIVYWSNR
jgi:hypothetical protein